MGVGGSRIKHMYEGAGTSGSDATPTPVPTDPTTDPTNGPTTESTPVTLDLTGPALAVVEGFTRWVAALAPATVEGENLGRITVLESVKNVCAAAQARETVAFDETRREAEAGRGVPAKERGKGVASEVALARRLSPSQGSRQLGLARALVAELPHTMGKLTAGLVSEWRATIVAKETGWLPVEGRRHVDAQLAPILTTVGEKRLAAEARRLAQAWDPAEAVRHLKRAESERCVTVRPSPDAMVYLTALVPMVQGIAAYAAVKKHADTAIGTGQAGDKTRGQVMADTLIERLTGQETAAAVPVEVHLLMTDAALLGGNSEDASQEPAWVVGHGPLPAATARALLSPDNDGPSGRARAWIRRLYTTPDTGHLVAMDSHRRTFDGLLRRMVALRDDTCRTPWCDAPIRHIDHATPHAAGGATSYSNASGLCERCNQVKENPGWTHTATPDSLTVTTPTGQEYTTPTHPLTKPRGRPPGRGDPTSPLEHHHTRWIDIHWLPHAS